MIHRLRDHRCAPPLSDVATARALDLVVLEVDELRPLWEEGLAACVAEVAAVLAEWALVTERAGGPAVLDGGSGGNGTGGC